MDEIYFKHARHLLEAQIGHDLSLNLSGTVSLYAAISAVVAALREAPEQPAAHEEILNLSGTVSMYAAVRALAAAMRAAPAAAGGHMLIGTYGADGHVSAPEQQPTPDQRSPSYAALLLIVQSVAAALARAGVKDCDDPGEAIDVLLAQRAVPEGAMFGRIIEADFSKNTLTLEMEAGYRAFSGRVMLSGAQPQGEEVQR